MSGNGLAHEESIYYDTDASYVDVYFYDENDIEHIVYDIYLGPGSQIDLAVGQSSYGVIITYEDGTGDYYEAASNGS